MFLCLQEVLREKWHSYLVNMHDDDETESFLRNSEYQKSGGFVAEAASFGASTLGAVKQGFRSGMRGMKKVFVGNRRPDDTLADNSKSSLFHRIKNTMTREKETVF